MTYQFAVAAIFKNERHAIVEWIEHYLFHGAEHIYLIDDNSTDNTSELIQPYISKNKVTLFNIKWDYYLGRQRDIYNHYILPIMNAKETKWLLICDLDEFIWSPLNIDLKIVLKNCNHLSQIQINNTLFESSGFIEQPSCIVKYFLYKEKEKSILYKYFVNSEYKFSSLNVHHASYVNEEDSIGTFIILDNNMVFRYNHYRVQSFNFWKNVKCSRGDVDNYLIRDERSFHDLDKNEIEDLDLWQQNKDMDFYKNL
jgi:hypothetical protein